MIGYLDLPSGLAGDMLLGCLLDAGWPVDELRQTIERLNLPADEWSIVAESVMKGPIRAQAVRPKVKEGHAHRHLRHIREMINEADLTDAVKRKSIAVFTRLAEAEAAVHDSTPEKIHFHEVGALDAIIDIVGSVAGLEALGIDALHAGSVPLSEGFAQTEHGQIPLPAPATLQILAQAHAPTKPGPGEGELVTPTGAALLAELASFSQPAMRLSRLGTGAGTKDFNWPNITRLWLGESDPAGTLVELQTNIDDMAPALYDPVTRELFEAGAVDAWLTPVQMKKQRPGVVLSVLAPAELESLLAELLIERTTTLGVRVSRLSHRYAAQRETREVNTPFGPVTVKLKKLNGETLGAMPEYDACVRLAEQQSVSVKQVHDATLAAAQDLVQSSA